MSADPQALRAIYDEHIQFVWRALRRFGVRESDLPDAAQDVFVVVHRKLPEFEARSKMTTWLFGISMRVARDRSRLAHERRRVDDEGALALSVDPSPDAHANAERRQAAALLDEILDQMPIEQRAVFSLFELDGQRGEDIAELCEIPLGTVYSRLRLARETFQRAVARLRSQNERRDGRVASSGDTTSAPPPRVSEVRVVTKAAGSERRAANTQVAGSGLGGAS